MKYLKISLPLLICIAFSCTEDNKKVAKNTSADAIQQESSIAQSPIKINKDTLQFIHFDGNFDHWYAFFLTPEKDTLRLVTDKQLEIKQLGKLLEVQWRLDTLFEAGENEKKYTDKRLINFKEIDVRKQELFFTEKHSYNTNLRYYKLSSLLKLDAPAFLLYLPTYGNYKIFIIKKLQ